MVLAPLASGERRHAGEREPRLDRCVCARGDESFWEVTDAGRGIANDSVVVRRDR